MGRPCSQWPEWEQRTAAWWESCTDKDGRDANGIKIAPPTFEPSLRDRLKRSLNGLPPSQAISPQGRRAISRERTMIQRAMRNDPHSNRSTITGPIRHDNLGGGGPSQKISRPSFLGGGGSNIKGGIELDGKVEGHEGNLDGIHDATKALPR
jgi:hypothetical protein